MRTKLLAGVVVATGALSLGGVAIAQGDGTRPPAPGLRADATTFHLHGVTAPDGEVFVPVDGRELNEEIPDFKVGDRAFFRELIYTASSPGSMSVADHEPRGPLGQALIECTIHRVIEGGPFPDAEAVCDAVIEIDGQGRLYLQTALRFSEFEDPGYITGGVTGGDGTFAGAGGEFVVSDENTQDPNDDPNETFSVYEVRL